MLKLRSIGLTDYRVPEGRQSIGRIRLAKERTPPIWLWTVNIHLTGGLPKGGQGPRHGQAQGDRAEPPGRMEDDPFEQCNPPITPTKTVTTNGLCDYHRSRTSNAEPWRLSAGREAPWRGVRLL